MTSLNYIKLKDTLHEAYLQASEGKGAERHANGLPFEQQPMLTLARMIPPSPISGLVFQACKKAIEASGMAARGEFAAAKRDLHGSAVYDAAAAILVDELADAEKGDDA